MFTCIICETQRTHTGKCVPNTHEGVSHLHRIFKTLTWLHLEPIRNPPGVSISSQSFTHTHTHTHTHTNTHTHTHTHTHTNIHSHTLTFTQTIQPDAVHPIIARHDLPVCDAVSYNGLSRSLRAKTRLRAREQPQIDAGVKTLTYGTRSCTIRRNSAKR